MRRSPGGARSASGGAAVLLTTEPARPLPRLFCWRSRDAQRSPACLSGCGVASAVCIQAGRPSVGSSTDSICRDITGPLSWCQARVQALAASPQLVQGHGLSQGSEPCAGSPSISGQGAGQGTQCGSEDGAGRWTVNQRPGRTRPEVVSKGASEANALRPALQELRFP